MKQLIALLILLIGLTGTAYAFLNDQILAGKTRAPTPPGPTITAVALGGGTTGSYTTGASSGTSVGAITVTTSNSSTYNGNLSLSGASPTDFSLSSTTTPSNLTTNGSTPTCTSSTPYNLNIVAAPGSGESGSNFTQPVTVTCNPSGGTSVYPNAIFVANDTTTNMVIAYFTVNNAPFPTTGACNWSGDSIATTATYEVSGDPFGIMACGIQTNRALSSSDNGTHIGTISGTAAGGASFSQQITITVGATPTSPPPNMNDTLFAWIDQNPLSQITYANPTVADVFAYASGSDNPCTVGLDSRNPNRPNDYEFDLVRQTQQAGTCSATDWHQAALGNYTSIWKSALQSGAINTYNKGFLTEILMMNEWQGNCGQDYSPYWNGPECSGTGSDVAPADWIAAIQNFATMLHTTFPGVKLALHEPLGANSGTHPDAAYLSPALTNGSSSALDFTGTNLYFYNTVGGTPAYVWQGYNCVNYANGSNCPWAHIAGFSALMGGIPVTVNELCDAFNNDTYTWPRALWFMSQDSHFAFAQIANNNYDTPDTVSTNNNCDMTATGTTANTFAAIVSPRDYTAKYIPGCTSASVAYPGGGTCPAE